MDKFADVVEKLPVAEAPQQHVKQCFAYGCPRYPTITIESTMTCRWHFRRSGESLPHITRRIRLNESLLDWHDRLMQMTHGDFDIGYVAKQAPYQLEPGEEEKFRDYKARISELVASKLYPQKQDQA